MKKTIAILLFVLLLFSCSTLTSLTGELPSWVTSPPVIAASTVIVGEGTGQSEEEAKTNAIMNVLYQMGEENGISYSDIYFRELYSTSMIAQFGTELSSVYSQEKDGVWYYYVLTVSNTTKLNEARSKDYLDRLDRENRIEAKVEESLSYYKANKDVYAINSLLEAVLISLEGNTSKPEYSTDYLIDRAVKYASQLTFEFLGKTKKTNGENGFKILRNKGVLKAPVEDATVKIYYPSLTPEGTIMQSSYDAKSDDRGIVIVNSTNAYSLKKGEITIAIELDEDILSQIEAKTDNTFLSSLREQIELNKLSAEYAKKETYKDGECIFAIALFDYDGSSIDYNIAKDIILDMCSTLSLTPPEVVELGGEDQEEALDYLKENYSDKKIIYMVRIGIVDRVSSLGLVYAYSEGTITKIDNSTGTTKEYPTMHYAISGDSEEDSSARLLEYQIRITCGYLLGEF